MIVCASIAKVESTKLQSIDQIYHETIDLHCMGMMPFWFFSFADKFCGVG